MSKIHTVAGMCNILMIYGDIRCVMCVNGKIRNHFYQNYGTPCTETMVYLCLIGFYKKKRLPLKKYKLHLQVTMFVRFLILRGSHRNCQLA